MERIYFIINLKDLIKQRKINTVNLDQVIESKIGEEKWVTQIPNDGLYRKIFEYPMTKFRTPDTSGSGSSVTSGYINNSDVVRYINACFSHVNDKDYDDFRDTVLNFSVFGPSIMDGCNFIFNFFINHLIVHLFNFFFWVF